MSAPSLNYQLAYASGNAVNAFTLHDANGAVVTPASIANVASGGYTAVGVATFSGSDSAASGSPITLTAPGNYRLSTTSRHHDQCFVGNATQNIASRPGAAFGAGVRVRGGKGR